MWESLYRIIEICEKEQTDLLLIAGDLFHRQPLLRELREVNALFRKLSKTKVVLCAGNHDYLKKDSYYRTFQWENHVHMILSEQMTVVDLPEIKTAVYGFSYHAKEVGGKPYLTNKGPRRCEAEILLLHGGDEKHVPVKKDELAALGYDYIAMGHIHKPGSLITGRAAYAGALEPIDKNDTGAHGYIRGEIISGKCKIQFVPFALREYIHAEVAVTGEMRGSDLRREIQKTVEKGGTQNIYKIILKGFRSPDVLFDLQVMDTYGNVTEIVDDTKPSYDYGKIKRQNSDNILGKLIGQLEVYDEDSVQYRAMCEGVQVLLETRRG